MDELKAPLPWQQEAWQQLQQARSTERLAHAMLLEGPRGTGKQLLASAIAASLLCERTDADGHACGHCRSCALFKAETHPDFLVVGPDNERATQIGVDSIRHLSELTGLKSQYHARRVVIVSPAEAMNANAANALLKTLEEPAADTLLLLVSSHPARLPATVRSRCQRLTVKAPARDTARQWLSGRHAGLAPEQIDLVLDFSGNAPLLAADMLAGDFVAVQERLFSQWETICMRGVDPLAVAAEWSAEMELDTVLRWLSYICMGLIRVRTGAGRQGLPEALQQRLATIAEAVSPEQVFLYLDVLYYYRQIIDHPVNQTLVLETLLIPWWYKLEWPLESLIRSDPTERAAATWP